MGQKNPRRLPIPHPLRKLLFFTSQHRFYKQMMNVRMCICGRLCDRFMERWCIPFCYSSKRVWLHVCSHLKVIVALSVFLDWYRDGAEVFQDFCGISWWPWPVCFGSARQYGLWLNNACWTLRTHWWQFKDWLFGFLNTWEWIKKNAVRKLSRNEKKRIYTHKGGGYQEKTKTGLSVLRQMCTYCICMVRRKAMFCMQQYWSRYRLYSWKTRIEGQSWLSGEKCTRNWNEESEQRSDESQKKADYKHEKKKLRRFTKIQENWKARCVVRTWRA